MIVNSNLFSEFKMQLLAPKKINNSSLFNQLRIHRRLEVVEYTKIILESNLPPYYKESLIEFDDQYKDLLIDDLIKTVKLEKEYQLSHEI